MLQFELLTGLRRLLTYEVFGALEPSRFRSHRALAALDALFLSSSFVIRSTLARPPFNPPRRPKATAIGFLPPRSDNSIRRWTSVNADSFSSRAGGRDREAPLSLDAVFCCALRERFRILTVSHEAENGASNYSSVIEALPRGCKYLTNWGLRA